MEFYKNLELVASVDAPPYQATITASPSEQFYVTVEAIDDAANRATVTRAFAAAAAMPVDAGVGGSSPTEPQTPPVAGGQANSSCSFGGGAPANGWPLVLLALAGLALRRRQRPSP